MRCMCEGEGYVCVCGGGGGLTSLEKFPVDSTNPPG